MAKLTPAQRKRIPASKFGLSSVRKFPMQNRSHAANAKARASQQEHAGRITPGQKAEIDRKADAVLANDSVEHGRGMKNPNHND